MRVFTRAMKMSEIEFWYTQGYNPRMYITVNQPLSLGFSGDRESLDTKIIDDTTDFSLIREKINKSLPEDLRVFDISEPIMKSSEIHYSLYRIELKGNDDIHSKYLKLLSENEIVVEKKSKSGVKNIDIKPYFADFTDESTDKHDMKFSVVLPSGPELNINPKLVIDAYISKYNEEPYFKVNRCGLYNAAMDEFK
jgi:radical SAM-linked protein